MPQQQKDNLLWFAAKVSSNRKLVDGIVAHDCVETYTAGVVPNILSCTATASILQNFRAQLRGVSDVKYFLFRLQNIYA